MGRSENAVAPCARAHRNLVDWLREQKAVAGLSYEAMAVLTTEQADAGYRGCSADTLGRAASGNRVPSLPVVLAYAHACGAEQAEATRLWKRARYEATQTAAARPTRPAPNINYVQNYADLHAALLDLYRKDGARPYRELEKASRWLPHSTVSRVIARTTLPSKEFVRAFAAACGIRGQSLTAWEQAFERAAQNKMGNTYAIGQQVWPPRPAPLRPNLPPRPRPATIAGETKVYSDPYRLPDGTEVRRETRVDGSGGRYTYIDGRMVSVKALSDIDVRPTIQQRNLSERQLKAARSLIKRQVERAFSTSSQEPLF